MNAQDVVDLAHLMAVTDNERGFVERLEDEVKLRMDSPRTSVAVAEALLNGSINALAHLIVRAHVSEPALKQKLEDLCGEAIKVGEARAVVAEEEARAAGVLHACSAMRQELERE